MDMFTVHRDVAKSSRAVILNVGIGRVEERHEHRDRTRVDELLSVLICDYVSVKEIPHMLHIYSI